MAVLNLKTQEIECKIVYYGPGRGGKTTNLKWIHKNYGKNVIGDMISIDTEGDRTLFFDFLPMELGQIKGCDIRIQLYTVPGQVQYTTTRKLVLRGVDGIVFVADSMEVRREKNMLSLRDLNNNLKELGLNIFKMPLAFQFNKRDLAKQGVRLMPLEMMQRDLNRQLKAPMFASSAINGVGVGKALHECLKQTLVKLQREFRWAG
jgi:signal recognition particle receptor subunit beta